jgi:3-hydroxy acid dehydrogenase/malonic semialdehyde reductase
MSKIILVTGATAGFGEAIALQFASAGYKIILNGRRQERLIALQKLLKDTYNAESYILPFDVRDNMAVKTAIASLPAAWQQISILINNAGLAAGLADLQSGNTDDWDVMIDTNLKGLLYVTRAVVPLMIANENGHIFNIGSIAGKWAYAKGNVYCATKFAVDALSQSMRIDFLHNNIKVTAIHPGAAETEFSIVRYKGDMDKAKKVYEGFKPLEAKDIADAVYYCATLPPHVCINDLVITPTTQASPHYNRKLV